MFFSGMLSYFWINVDIPYEKWQKVFEVLSDIILIQKRNKKGPQGKYQCQRTLSKISY